MKKTMRNLTNALVIGAMLISVGSLAFADSQSQSSDAVEVKQSNIAVMNSEQKPDKLKAVLEEKVKDGTITQQQADKVLEKLCIKKTKEDFKKLDPQDKDKWLVERKARLEAKLAEKVAKGEITREEADNFLKNGYKPKDRQFNNKVDKLKVKQKRTAMFETKLSNLVKEEVITQQQADEILKAIQAVNRNKKAIDSLS